jgi:ribosomal protein S27E
VSFQSRQKRRRYKQAVERSKRQHSDETAGRWFLTLARKQTKCSHCGDVLRVSAEMVYRHEPRETRCVRCASRLEDSKGYRPSLRWERSQQRKAA